MINATLPANEKQRLLELKSFRILDTEQETVLDEITKLAAKICGTKISLISLLDENRQWFKSKYGIEASETPRDISYCGHAILEDELFVVEDATKDERFIDNPLLTGKPHVRFYAGAQLKTKSGLNIGTLCVIDSEPKQLSQDQKEMLELLAQQVISIFEMRKKNIQLLYQHNELNEAQKISQVGSWKQDLQTNENTWTTVMYSIFELPTQITDQELLEKSRARIHPEDLTVVDFYVGSARQTFKNYEVSYRLTFDKGKRIKYVFEQGKVFLDKAGEPDYLIRTVRDRTEELNSEAKYKDLLSSMHEGLVVHAEDGTIIEHNKAALEILGINTNQLLGKTSTDPQWKIIKQDQTLFTAEEHPSSVCLTTKKPVHNVIMGVHKPDGKISWISTSAVPHIRNDEFQVIVNFTDITKFVEAMNHKLEVEHMHHTLMHGLNQQFIIARTDFNGTIVYVNELFCKISQYEASELLGQDHRILNSGYHSKEFFDQLWNTIKAGNVWRGEICNRAKDGSLYWVSTKIFPETDDSGEILGFFSLRHDITKQKVAEAELQNEREKSAFAAQLAAVGEMSAGIAHEIANPLTVITGQAELLKINKDNPEKIIERSDKISKGALRINKIIKGLHYLAQRSRNEQHEEHLLDEILQNTLEFCSEALKNKEIELIVEKPNHGIKLICNDIKISQILLNLINNAKDAIIEANSKDRWVKLIIEQESKILKMCVIDSGPGIPEDVKEKIGESFYTTKPIGKGTGLGLALVKRFVKEHKGKLEIDSDCENTCFKVTLPLN